MTRYKLSSLNRYFLIWTCFAVSPFPGKAQEVNNAFNRDTFFPKEEILVSEMPSLNKVHVFILAGQSNMAGRGQVMPEDTLIDARVWTINSNNQVILAKEPMHWYEPNLRGLDCGLSFAKKYIKSLPADEYVLIIPTAVGGSNTTQWLSDANHRGVNLLSNFKQKAALAKSLGTIEAILWHQGEGDANENAAPGYVDRIVQLFQDFRNTIGNDQLPILLGELGNFGSGKDEWMQLINQKIHELEAIIPGISVIYTGDLKDKGDKLHFDSHGQRTMGIRFAEAYLQTFSSQKK